jgi:hypothetical protein
VREAFRLLKTSIIHVESEAVRLEDEEDEEVDHDNAGAMDVEEDAQPLRAEVEGPADGSPGTKRKEREVSSQEEGGRAGVCAGR